MTPRQCKHSDRGLSWLMQPVPGGEARRVKLCPCGATTTAKIGTTGELLFDRLAVKALRRQVVVAQ